MGTYGNHIKNDHFKSVIKSPLNYQPFHQVLQPLFSKNPPIPIIKLQGQSAGIDLFPQPRPRAAVPGGPSAAAPEEWKNPEECGKDM